VMIDYFTDIPQPIPMMVSAETQVFYRWSESRTELYVKSERLQLQSRITNQSQFQFRDPSYTTTKPRWQSTIDMM
jgi:hypothetical protein